MRQIFLLFLSFLLSACSQSDSSKVHSNISKMEVFGRLPLKNPPVYALQVPSDWICQDRASDWMRDTTKPICELFIQDAEGRIRITIHNFPSLKMEDRIPPMAQILRWKRQLTNIDQTTLEIIPQAYAGFVGFLFMGSGMLKEEPSAVMGWSMQIAPEHYRALTKMFGLSGDPYFQQMQADYTIKATGSKRLIKKYKQAIIAFARSFELIEEIPTFS